MSVINFRLPDKVNPLAIYKKLPRDNCGKCPALTCMSFAVRLSKKELSVSECQALDENSKKEIDGMISSVIDWKEKRLAELFDEISRVNFQTVAEGIGAVNEKNTLKIMYMGKEVAISPSGFQDELGIWDKLLVLMYIKTAGSGRLSGKWTAFRDLKNGLIRANSFNEACEKSLARLYGKTGESLLTRLKAMNAGEASGFSADHSYVLYPLPRIPFLVLLWSGDPDFEPDCKILLDSTATEYLDVEALLYLGMSFTGTVKAGMSRDEN